MFSSLHYKFTDLTVTQTRVQSCHSTLVPLFSCRACRSSFADIRLIHLHSALQSATRAEYTIVLGKVACRVLSYLQQTEYNTMREPSIFVRRDLYVIFVTRRSVDLSDVSDHVVLSVFLYNIPTYGTERSIFLHSSLV